MRALLDEWGGFVPKLRAASEEDLQRDRARCVRFGKIFAVTALILLVVTAVIAATSNDRGAESLLFCVAILQLFSMMIMQVKVWFIDLVLGERTPQGS